MQTRSRHRISKKRKRRQFIIRSILLVLVLVIILPPAIKIVKKLGKEKEPVLQIPPEIMPTGTEHPLEEYPEELIDLYIRNEEARQFVLDYFDKKDIEFEIDLTNEVQSGKVPLFMQWDERWGYTKYGDGMIALSACGPVSLSMVAVHLTGNLSFDPRAIAAFSYDNGYYVKNNGTSWKLMSEGAERLGLTSKELPLDENAVARELYAGRPVICIMGEGDFTTGGHYIVLTGYSDGYVSVNDPNSYKNSEKLWKFSEIQDQIRNMWSYSI